MAEARLQSPTLVLNGLEQLHSERAQHRGIRERSSRCCTHLDFHSNALPGQLLTGKGFPLLYKPYMDSLWSSLTVAAPGLKSSHLEADLRLQRSDRGQQGAEVQNWLFCSNRLQCIRLTYFNAGSAGQAFNSLLYPDHRFDYPLLGIDLLAFGKGKVLCVVDFQPLSQDPSYLEKYTARLAPIHNDFSMYCSKMSTRIYNENEFFSKHLIFYRSDKGAADPLLQVLLGI